MEGERFGDLNKVCGRSLSQLVMSTWTEDKGWRDGGSIERDGRREKDGGRGNTSRHGREIVMKLKDTVSWETQQKMAGEMGKVRKKVEFQLNKSWVNGRMEGCGTVENRRREGTQDKSK